ncbi:MAG: MFS transporter, partial [Hyphomonadaceae bacterium]
MTAINPTPEAAPAQTLLQQRDYLRFWLSRWAGNVGSVIQGVALGWQVYALARQTMSIEQSALMLGMVGLAAFLPVLLLTLPAGEAADRYDRKLVVALCLTAESLTVGWLLIAATLKIATVPMLLIVAAMFGASRVFFAPATTALGPMLVPRALLPRAIAWNSLAWQLSAVIGPAIGGLLVAHSAGLAYGAALALYGTSLLLTLTIRANAKPQAQPGSRWALIKEGLGYVWRNKIVYGAISLDLFAVLLGGATALLPAFARDVLHVGPEGFGAMGAAPA